MVQLHRDESKIAAAGGTLIVIGNGGPSFIEGFREHTGYNGPLYTDPSLRVYQAAELKRGVFTTLNPLALVPTIKAFARGSKQGATQGDSWQQGGVLVIAKDGTIRWHHASDRPGDNATTEEIVAALNAKAA